MNPQEHGQSQEGETVTVRGTEEEHDVYNHAHSGAALAGVGSRTGSEFIGFDRKNSQEGTRSFNPFGGVIDQLIDDAKKQLVKSQECIVWYRAEVQEYQEKLDNLIKLKELQEQQYQEMLRQQEAQRQQQTESSNDSDGGNVPAQ